MMTTASEPGLGVMVFSVDFVLVVFSIYMCCLLRFVNGRWPWSRS